MTANGDRDRGGADPPITKRAWFGWLLSSIVCFAVTVTLVVVITHLQASEDRVIIAVGIASSDPKNLRGNITYIENPTSLARPLPANAVMFAQAANSGQRPMRAALLIATSMLPCSLYRISTESPVKTRDHPFGMTASKTELVRVAPRAAGDFRVVTSGGPLPLIPVSSYDAVLSSGDIFQAECSAAAPHLADRQRVLVMPILQTSLLKPSMQYASRLDVQFQLGRSDVTYSGGITNTEANNFLADDRIVSDATGWNVVAEWRSHTEALLENFSLVVAGAFISIAGALIIEHIKLHRE